MIERAYGFAALVCVAVLLLLTAPSGLVAQEVESGELREMTIQELMGLNIRVASTTEKDILGIPSTVTVIDADMIRDYNLLSVSEAVNLVAGFSVLRTYIKRNLPTSRGVLQDHYANKVLVMINNVPCWMGVTGEANLDRIDINDVDRIEVLKGPASVLYGTNAYSGAINIILKNPRQHASSVQLGVAENNGFKAGGNYLFSEGDLEMFISANAFDDSGQDFVFTDEVGDSGPVDQFVNSRNFTVNASFKDHTFLLNTYKVDESFLGTTPRFSLGVGHPHLLEGVVANYTFSKRIADRVDLDLGATWDSNERNFSRSFDDDTRANVDGERVNGFARAVFEVSRRFTIESGASWERRTSNEYKNYTVHDGVTLADNNMADRDVDEYSVLLQANYQGDAFNILVGTRYTDNELFGNDLSSRGALVYSINKSSSLKLLYGESFRVPSLFELYFRTPTNTVYGNTDLKPETNQTIELAYLTSFGNLFFEALAYRAEYDGKIFRTRRYPDYVDDPNDTSTIYVNGEKFEADGLELSLAYRRPKALSAFVSYSWVDGNRGDEIEGSDHYNFKYVPEHTLSAGLAKTLGDFSVSGVLCYQSSVQGPISEIDDQITVDLNLSYRQTLSTMRVRHTLSAKNLTDDEIPIPEYVRRNINEVPSGYGRRVSYTLTLSF